MEDLWKKKYIYIYCVTLFYPMIAKYSAYFLFIEYSY